MFTDLPQLVPQKVCLSCQGCCRFPDAKSPWRPRLAGDEQKVFSPEETDNGYIRAARCADCTKCTFLNPDDNTCKVYARRPFECRLYPFVLWKTGHRVTVGVHFSCPFVQEQRHTKAFEEGVARLKRYMARGDVRDFLQDNPALLSGHPVQPGEVEELFVLGGDV